MEVHPSFFVLSTVPHGFYDVHHIFRLRVLRVLRYDDFLTTKEKQLWRFAFLKTFPYARKRFAATKKTCDFVGKAWQFVSSRLGVPQMFPFLRIQTHQME